MSQIVKPQIPEPAPRGFWLRVLGMMLIFGSVGLVSCQALLGV